MEPKVTYEESVYPWEIRAIKELIELFQTKGISFDRIKVGSTEVHFKHPIHPALGMRIFKD